MARARCRRLEASFGFGLRSPLRFADPREQRRSENLQKFFPLAARFPWLLPIVRRLVELPQNRVFDALYLACVNIGFHLVLGAAAGRRADPVAEVLRHGPAPARLPRGRAGGEPC